MRQNHEVQKVENGLFVITYSMLLPEWIKFRMPLLFMALVKGRLKRIIRNYSERVDYSFDFGCYQLFDSDDFFPAQYKIFFPVDDFSHLKGDTRGCDKVFTVSKEIQKKFPNNVCHFINHGLSDDFVSRADQESKHESTWRPSDKIRAGYAGNIYLRFIDFEMFEDLIRGNPDVEFHFYGSGEPAQNDPTHNQWTVFLRTASNVVLHGWVSHKRLADVYQELDLFILCYRPDYQNYHGENSHKILEYLSTGKVTVSSHISLYKGTGLLEMMNSGDRNMSALFRHVTTHLGRYNSIDKMKSRRKFAMDNSYEKQIERIENLIDG